jgi:hypothetical protein
MVAKQPLEKKGTLGAGEILIAEPSMLALELSLY